MKLREEFKDPGDDEEHSRLKQHGNHVHLNVACTNGKIVQAIELHKWRKYGHQHDQGEYDLWHLARHSILPALELNSARRPVRRLRRL